METCEAVPLGSAVVSPPSVGSEAACVLAIVAESEFEPASSVVVAETPPVPELLLPPVVLPSPPELDEPEPPCESEAPLRSSPQAAARVRAPTSSQCLV